MATHCTLSTDFEGDNFGLDCSSPFYKVHAFTLMSTSSYGSYCKIVFLQNMRLYIETHLKLRSYSIIDGEMLIEELRSSLFYMVRCILEGMRFSAREIALLLWQ